MEQSLARRMEWQGMTSTTSLLFLNQGGKDISDGFEREMNVKGA